MQNLGDSLFGVQKKSIFVGSEIARKLSGSMRAMEDAARSFELGNDAAGQAQANEAMAQMNGAAQNLIGALQNVSKGGSATGMDQFLTSLSSISFGQMMLNQSLEGLLPIPLAGMSQSMKEQVGRLAARQRQLREALDGLKEAVGDSKTREFIDAMTQDMARTEQDLFQYKVDRQLIERQQKILYRLLDAQKSIRKQDNEKTRVAEAGRDFTERTRPGALPADLGERQRRLREVLLQALKENHRPEYEKFIRAYFNALMNE